MKSQSELPIDGVRGSRSPVMVVAIVAVLAVALAGAFLAGRHTASDRSDAQRAKVLAVSDAFTTSLMSYDKGRLDENVSAVLKESTGAFRKEYSAASAGLKQLLTEAGASATCKVVASGVSSLKGDRAVVVVFVDQTVSNKTLDKPRTDRNRIRLKLQKSSNRWLVNSVELL